MTLLCVVFSNALAERSAQRRSSTRTRKEGGKLGDFELKLKHRLVSENAVNGGFQFRSEMFDGDIPDDCRGYQVDNNTQTDWLVRLYDEFGRHTLAWRGERTVFGEDGEPTTTPIEEAKGDLQQVDTA